TRTIPAHASAEHAGGPPLAGLPTAVSCHCPLCFVPLVHLPTEPFSARVSGWFGRARRPCMHTKMRATARAAETYLSLPHRGLPGGERFGAGKLTDEAREMGALGQMIELDGALGTTAQVDGGRTSATRWECDRRSSSG